MAQLQVVKYQYNNGGSLWFFLGDEAMYTFQNKVSHRQELYLGIDWFDTI
jgi:hypothetical protein